jgi:glyceraldehyde-3-phosphate dehydrogenase (NADP+)
MSTWVHSPAAVFPSLAEIPTTARTDYYDGAFYLVIYGEGSEIIGPIVKSGRIDVLAFIGSAKVGALLKHQHRGPTGCARSWVWGPKMRRSFCPTRTSTWRCPSAFWARFLSTASDVRRLRSSSCIAAGRRSSSRASPPRWKGYEWGCPGRTAFRLPRFPSKESRSGSRSWWRTPSLKAPASYRGGSTIDGSLFHPAVLYPARPAMKMAQVEQIGPVTPVVPYDEEREVVDWIVSSPVGQQAALFGQDPERLSRLIDPLVNQVCRVNLNSQCQRGPDRFPFGGRKDSVEGTLSVSDALRAFSIRSMVAARSTESNQKTVSRIVSGRHSNFLATDFIF